MTTDQKNRYHYAVQLLIGYLGDECSTRRLLIQRLVLYRQYPDRLLEDNEEGKFLTIFDEACHLVGKTRERVLDEGARLKRQFEVAERSIEAGRNDLEGFRKASGKLPESREGEA